MRGMPTLCGCRQHFGGSENGGHCSRIRRALHPHPCRQVFRQHDGLRGHASRQSGDGAASEESLGTALALCDLAARGNVAASSPGPDL